MTADVISEAKSVVTSHKNLAMAGDLDGVMTNVADDVAVLAYGVPLIEGNTAFREFYSGLMTAGKMKFGHDYLGADSIGNDVVVLRGVSRGSMTTKDGETSRFSNNFVHILRRSADGRFKMWRAAFAPDSQAPLAG